MAGADAHHVSLPGEGAEALAAVEELRQFVGFAVHPEAVIRQPQAAQQVHPLRVVPLRRVRQLAELRITGDRRPAGGELVRQRHGARDVGTALAVRQHGHVVLLATVVGLAREQALVDAFDEELVRAELLQRLFERRRVGVRFLMVLPGSTKPTELRGLQQAARERDLIAVEVTTALVVEFERRGRPIKDDPVRLFDEGGVAPGGIHSGQRLRVM